MPTATAPAMHPLRAEHSDGPAPFRVYARASTLAQDESVEQQLDVAERDLRAMGLLAPDRRLPRHHAPEEGVYCDDGQSAYQVPPSERDGARALLADVAANPQPVGRPGIIWVWAQSRYLRTEDGAAEAIAELYPLSKIGWALYSHEQRRCIQLTGPDSLLNVFTAAIHGAKDSEHSREKAAAVKRAKRRQLEQGIWIGGFPPPGYERWVARIRPAESGQDHIEWVAPLAAGCQNGWHGTITLLRPTEHADAIRSLFAMVADGIQGQALSINEVHRRLDDGTLASPVPGHRWRRTSIQSLLTNLTYIAVQCDEVGITYPAQWEPIVDRALWQRVQDRIASNRVLGRGVGAAFPLSGLLFCAACKARFAGEQQQPKGGALQRYYRVNTPLRVDDVTRCRSCVRRIRADIIEAAVLQELAHVAEHPSVVQALAFEQQMRVEGASTMLARMTALKHEESEVQRKIDNLLTSVTEGTGMVADRLHAMLAKLNATAASLVAERSTLSSGRSDAVASLCSATQMMRQIWDSAGGQERRDLTRAFVARLEVDVSKRVLHVGLRLPVGAPTLT